MSKPKTTRKTKPVSPPLDRIWIGDAIRAWRKSNSPSLTREELANELGQALSALFGQDVSRCLSTLRKWEKGQSEPHASELLAMDVIKPGLIETLHKIVVRRSRRR